MLRGLITAERKAYFFMIDWAINVCWTQYCGWHGSFHVQWESLAIEMARDYARKNNIMPWVEVIIPDSWINGFMSRCQAEREFGRLGPRIDERRKID